MSENTSRKRCRAKRERKRVGLEGEDSLVDTISALPDDIVIGIVSLLPLKDAAATCVLSRRWEHVWKFSASLDFELSFEDYLYLTFSRRLTKEKDQEYSRFIDWVDSVIGKHRAPTIKRFRVCFGLNGRFLSFFVDRWMEFAMNKRVQILELTDHSNMYPFPQKLLRLEKESDLKLKRLDSADTPGYSTGFKFLRVLCFDYVHVTQEVLEHFLYNCPVLERLTVCSTNSLVGLRVSGPSIALKYLELIECGLKSVQICDTNLVSLTISQGAEISLLLSNVPSLVEISYDTSRSMDLQQFLTQISCCPQLEKLKLKLVVIRTMIHVLYFPISQSSSI